jgi:hypothetical protein
MAEERERQRAEIRTQQEERRKEQADRQHQWELQQLERLDEHPYQAQIDLCEELIYFCARHTRST